MIRAMAIMGCYEEWLESEEARTKRNSIGPRGRRPPQTEAPLTRYRLAVRATDCHRRQTTKGPPFWLKSGESHLATVSDYTSRGILVKAFLEKYSLWRIPSMRRNDCSTACGGSRAKSRRSRRASTQEDECSHILHTISACRGAMDALMAEVIEGHIRFHVLPPEKAATDEQTKAADDLMSALHAYLK